MNQIRINVTLLMSQISVICMLLISSTFLSAQSDETPQSTESILKTFAADYAKDQHFKTDWIFGVEVGKEQWTIEAIAKTDQQKASVKVLKGFPTTPTFYFKTTAWALQDIAAGKMNALTGAVKAFSTDYAPFDLEVMDGYQPDQNFVAEVLPLMFHFWTKGTPEIIPFGPQYARNTHGAQASIFYYQPGLRSGYGTIFPGQHANENPSSQTNPFPSLIIITKGIVTARLDGKIQEISHGNAIFIPPGMKHEFMNNQEEPVEFILLMFGDGA